MAPAYDLTHSMGPRPAFVGTGPGEHYLDVAGKGAAISSADLRSLAKSAGMKPRDIDDLVDAAIAATGHWPELAAHNGVDRHTIEEVAMRLPAIG